MQKIQEHFSARAWAFGAGNSVAGLVIPKLLDFLINSRDVGIPGFLLNGDQSLICWMIELLQFGLRQFALFKKLVFTNNSYIIVF